MIGGRGVGTILPKGGGRSLQVVTDATGPKIELLTPTGGSGAAFLDRFLAARGAGPHHFNFLVTDIEDALTLIKAPQRHRPVAHPAWCPSLCG